MPDRPDAGKLKSRQSQSAPPSLLSQFSSFVWRILLFPFERGLGLAIRTVRPITPQLIPLLICLLLVPFLILLSGLSGVYVWRSVAVGWEVPLYLQYGDGLPPYAEVSLPTLSAVQPYDFTLHLDVPAIDSNFHLGNFMSTLTLSTTSNKTIVTTRRPSMILPPTSSWIPFVSPKKRTVAIEVQSLNSYVTGYSHVVARIEIGRQDSWRSLGSGEGRELSVLSASVSGTVRHKGIRGLISRYPFMFGNIAAATFLLCSLAVLAACLLPSLRWDYNGVESEPVPNIKQESGWRVKKKRSSRRSKSLGRSRDDDPSAPIGEEGTSAIPLRRRRSRLQRDSDSD